MGKGEEMGSGARGSIDGDGGCGSNRMWIEEDRVRCAYCGGRMDWNHRERRICDDCKVLWMPEQGPFVLMKVYQGWSWRILPEGVLLVRNERKEG